MNNRNREHARIFDVPDAFYDLNGWGRQASESRKLTLGMKLLVVSQPTRDQLKFEEWQYTRDEPRFVEDKPVQVLCGRKTGHVEVMSREAAYAKHPVIFRRGDGRPALKLGWSILGQNSTLPHEVSAPEGTPTDNSAEWFNWLRSGESFDDWATAAEGVADLFATDEHTPEKQRAYAEENAYWVEIRMPLPGVRLIAFQLSLLDLRPKVSLKTWIDKDSPDVYRMFAGRRFFFRGQPAASYEDQSPNGTWAQQMKQKGVAVRGVVHDIALARVGRPGSPSEVLSPLFMEFCEFANACFDGTAGELTEQAPKSAVSLPPPEWQGDAERIEELLATLTSFSDTERDCLVKVRIGQTIFRRQLLARWGMKCSVTGLANPDVLIASHIVSWSR
jgi:hypothetical protein